MNKKLIYIFSAIFILAACAAIFIKPKSEFVLNLPNVKNMKIESNSFKNNQFIPKKYTCQGENVNPPLEFKDVPKEAKSLALIVDDPDAPMGTWSHWIIWNIGSDAEGIKENSVPENSIVGLNDFGNNNYGGPCPPSGTHRYFFKLYALDSDIKLEPLSKKIDLEKAMSGHIMDYGEIIGLYKK